ncbi:MAG: vitamin K epoxide reductase family protein [Dehalococcoidia bacterium]|jgi:uncharacterized membrane protein
MSDADLEAMAEDEDGAFWLGGQSGRLVASIIAVLSLAGIGVAGYLAYTHVLNQPVACAGFGSCDTVAQSKYAHLGGVPVSVLGLLGYVALFAVAALWLRVGDRFEMWPLLAIWGMSIGGAAYSVYLTYLELFVIDAICIWCATSAVIMFCILIVSSLALFASGREVHLSPD